MRTTDNQMKMKLAITRVVSNFSPACNFTHCQHGPGLLAMANPVGGRDRDSGPCLLHGAACCGLSMRMTWSQWPHHDLFIRWLPWGCRLHVLYKTRKGQQAMGSARLGRSTAGERLCFSAKVHGGTYTVSCKLDLGPQSTLCAKMPLKACLYTKAFSPIHARATFLFSVGFHHEVSACTCNGEQAPDESKWTAKKKAPHRPPRCCWRGALQTRCGFNAGEGLCIFISLGGVKQVTAYLTCLQTTKPFPQLRRARDLHTH